VGEDAMPAASSYPMPGHPGARAEELRAFADLLDGHLTR